MQSLIRKYWRQGRTLFLRFIHDWLPVAMLLVLSAFVAFYVLRVFVWEPEPITESAREEIRSRR